eukprot:scaffold285762_cov23-Tisochrysis_lutea.AAC.1
MLHAYIYIQEHVCMTQSECHARMGAGHGGRGGVGEQIVDLQARCECSIGERYAWGLAAYTAPARLGFYSASSTLP